MKRGGVSLVVSAPSGAGKSTLCAMLLKSFPNLSYSVSATTRAPREGEVRGRDYFFISRDEFERRARAGDFAECAEVHGNLYGTPLAPVEAALSEGRDILFDLDVRGAAAIRERLPQSKFVFILPPRFSELERRLRARGQDNELSMKKRLSDAAREIPEALWYDAVVVNDNLDEAYRELEAFYVAATLAPGCRKDFRLRRAPRGQGAEGARLSRFSGS